ncbi:MAG: glycosyltransferase family 1 protein [Patescibacteria group bacterium]|jgi:glycosyltransferase involved in cell wall biosynthesis
MNNPKKIKVALMSYAMDGRKAMGTAVYTRRLIEKLLADERFDFTLVHYEKNDDALYNKAKEIIISEFIYPSRFLRQLYFFWLYRHKKFDIIHWFQPRAYPGYWFAPARHKIITIHGGGKYYYPRFCFSAHVFHWVIKYFNSWFRYLIVCSKTAKEEASSTYKIATERLVVIYNGGGERFKPLDASESFKIIKKEYPAITGDYILSISRLQPHKNIANLVRAYIDMRQRSVREEKLVIVGKATEKYLEIFKIAEESEFSQDIIFINYIKEQLINRVYSAAKIFVFPSLSEGFGLPLVEAMASGVPVATSNVSCMPEIVSEAGILFDPNNTKNMADAIIGLLEDKELRDRLKEAGLKRAKIFTWEEAAEELKKLYLKLAVSNI